jgi:hypothetical protein
VGVGTKYSGLNKTIIIMLRRHVHYSYTLLPSDPGIHLPRLLLLLLLLLEVVAVAAAAGLVAAALLPPAEPALG